MARSMTMAGVRPGMTIHNANGYGLFTGGLGFHQGGERIGATVVPVSGGRTARQAMLLADLGAEVLVSTPSYALVIAQALHDSGVDPRRAAAGARAVRRRALERADARRDRARARPDARSTSTACRRCAARAWPPSASTARAGLHVQEDHFLVEVVDPADWSERWRPGEEGELVFTTLTKEALPLIRYRTGDIGSLIEEPCECGRTTVRLTGLRGRVDDMLIVRGVNLYPSQVEHALLGVDGVAPHYRLIVERPGAMDELTLECEAAGGADRESLRAQIGRLLREQTGLRITVSVLDPGALPRSEGKAVRVVDRRSERG